MRHQFLVLTNPVEGREDEYNDWYDNVHLDDVLAVDGFVAAQRFRLSTELAGRHPSPWRYLAIYEIEADDPAAALTRLQKVAGGGMVISSALDGASAAGWVFSPIGPRKTAN